MVEPVKVPHEHLREPRPRNRRLTVVTHAQNMALSHNAAKTHCKRGHPLSAGNLRIGPNGAGVCRACNAANQRAFRERHRGRGSS